MLKYELFYKQKGIRRINQIVNPVINNTQNLLLPFNSIFHYIPENNSVKGIPSDHWAVKTNERLTMVEHVSEFPKGLAKGNPRLTAVKPDLLVMDYHRKNRKMKKVMSLEKSLRDPKTLLVVNYSLLNDVYRYTKSFFSLYFKRINLIQSIWSNIESKGSLTERQNYVQIDIPTEMPKLSSLRKAEGEMSRAMLEEFKSFESLFLLDIWTWLGEDRKQSTMSVLSTLALSKTNLILTHYNKWVMINLGILDEWRKGIDAEGDLDPGMIQKKFLRLVITLFESYSVVEPNPTEEEPSANKAKENPLDILNPITEKEEQDSKQDIKKALKKDDDVEKQLEILNKDDNLNKPNTDANFFEEEIEYGESIKIKAESLASDGNITTREYNRYLEMSTAHDKIKDPFTGKGTIAGGAKITAEDLKISDPETLPDSPLIHDKGMLKTTVNDFDKKYVENILQKDVVNSVLNLTKAGVAVLDYEVEHKEDIANSYQKHKIKVSPVGGSSSTLYLKLPNIDKDGYFKANGVKYRMRKQRGDMPIRKVSPDKVALTSYYGKVFINRSSKVVDDYGNWLSKNIRVIGLDSEDRRVLNLKVKQKHNNQIKAPRIYTILADKFSSFDIGDVSLFLNYEKRKEFFGEDNVVTLEKDGLVLIGKKKSLLVLVDENDTFYYIKDVAKGDLEVLGKIEDILDLDRSKAPVDKAHINIFGKSIPLGFVLAYYIGIENLIDSLPDEVKKVPVGEKLNLVGDEYAIRFEDENIVVNKDDKLTSLILGSFNAFKKSLTKYSFFDFNKKDIYLNILEDYGFGLRILKELDLMRDMFIDPIALDLLKEMKEPTNWLGLLKRSAELLLTDYSPKETDLREMRIKGYERISGAVYMELVNSMRKHSAYPSGKIELNPYAVWSRINTDPSIVISEESNPVKNINEKESVSYVGFGGRGKVSMVARTRLYGKEEIGTISEATVDSADVGINTYTAANPKFNSLRGTTDRYDPKLDTPTNVLSTGALLSPGADMDDSKRVNFITIQHAQGISSKGYKPSPLRTGYDKVLTHRTDDLFCTTAKKKGVVTKLNKDAITVDYEDGETVSVELGKRFGKAAGAVYPHNVITGLKKGDKLKVGEVIAYNDSYFEKDPLFPKEVLWKNGVMVKTAILESNDTYEDSSVISERISKELGSSNTKLRELFIEFDQSISNLVKPGSKLDTDSILCIIEDSFTSNNELFSDETSETLKVLTGNAPKSKYSGTIDKIEILYFGDKEDMSPSLKALADEADKETSKKLRSLGKKPLTNELSDTLRIDNKNVEIDTMVIRVYITENDTAGSGDKGVFGNQMKTVFARVMSGRNQTESGEDIDAIFGYQSISARIILSPEIMGTTNTLLKVLSKKVVEVYKS